MRQDLNFIFSYDKFIYKPLSENLIEWARELHNDPTVLQNLTDIHVVEIAEQEIWFQKLQRSKTSKRVVVSERQTNVPIGLIRLDNIDDANSSICIGADIHKDYRGKGLAYPIYLGLLWYIFSIANFHRAWLLVADYNAIARHIYKKLHLIEEGIFREALLRDNSWKDYILMGILKNEYMKYYMKEVKGSI